MTVDLQIVAVDDSDEVVDLAVAGEHRGLPVLSLLELAITREHEHALRLGTIARSVEREAHGHAARDRKPLAERAGADLYAWAEVAIGMTLQTAAELAERDELLMREVADLRESGIEHGGGVTLREHEAVARGVLRICRIVAERAGKEECRHDVRRGKRPARVPAARRREHLDLVAAHAIRDKGDLRIASHARAPELICCHVHPFV